MWYPIRTPLVFQWAYRNCLWQKSREASVVYLSFDDGPHPEVTPFVLDELKKRDAKASFFCIGEHVIRYPDVFKRIIDEGHSVGNHTFNHLNGWKTNDDVYMENIKKAASVIPSGLFRPPYGRIRYAQLKKLEKQTDLKVVMWSLLSGDFDQKISPEQCARNVIDNIKKGDIVVFHDSIKTKETIGYALPVVLDFLMKKGIRCDAL